jgi:N6-L-threonylcarbamoyladenine synthase
MLILGVDTSCDDTSIAVLKAEAGNKFKLLSNIVSSQVKIHQKYGGVYPMLARRAHEKNLPKVLGRALADANVGIKDIDAISVTIGPGLDPCLWMSLNFVRALAIKWDIPIIPVNHIEGHILANLLPQIGLKIKFPAVCLVVSGGHTQLILMKKIGKYEILGETRDDAAGECFDKTARILGLGYPGGPAIAAQAAKAVYSSLRGALPRDAAISCDIGMRLPRPMLYTKDYDFSFSGLKTAVLYDYKKRSAKQRKSKNYIQAMSAEIQQAIIDVLLKKTIKASRDYKVKTIMLGGGVVANQELRTQFQNKIQKDTNFTLQIPDLEFCQDNGAMIAITGWFNRAKAIKSAKSIKNLKPIPNLRIS